MVSFIIVRRSLLLGNHFGPGLFTVSTKILPGSWWLQKPITPINTLPHNLSPIRSQRSIEDLSSVLWRKRGARSLLSLGEIRNVRQGCQCDSIKARWRLLIGKFLKGILLLLFLPSGWKPAGHTRFAFTLQVSIIRFCVIQSMA